MIVLGYTQTGTIRVILDGDKYESLVPDDMCNSHRQMIAAWEFDEHGNRINIIPAYAPPAPTLDNYRSAIQSLVDEIAQSRSYDSGNSLASYAASTIPQWSAEAQAFIAWRDQVWAYAYAELEKVEKLYRTQPTVEEFLAELPVIAWPTLPA